MTMQQVTIEVPEKVLLAEKMDATTFGRELRVLAAVKMYELGRLTSGRAADLAGMSRVEFLLSLQRYQVFPLSAELEESDNQHVAAKGCLTTLAGECCYEAGFRRQFCLRCGLNLATMVTSNSLERGSSPQVFRLFFQTGPAAFNPVSGGWLLGCRGHFAHTATYQS